MKRIYVILLGAFMAAAALMAANQTRTFKGVITCTMCKMDHKAMGISPADKCIRECIKHDKNSKYALMAGDAIYVLSDQQTPEKFAGRNVDIRGTLYEKTKILKVDSIQFAE